MTPKSAPGTGRSRKRFAPPHEKEDSRREEVIDAHADLAQDGPKGSDPSRTEHDGELERLGESRYGFVFAALKAGLMQLSGDVTGDFKGLREGASLGNKTRNAGACCQVTALRELLHLQVDQPFSHRLLPSGNGFKLGPEGARQQAIAGGSVAAMAAWAAALIRWFPPAAWARTCMESRFMPDGLTR
jgi:hypothetical protein